MAETLLLLTHDDSLVEALSGVVPTGCLIIVRDEMALAGELMSGQAGVVFIDAGSGAAQAGMTAQLTQRLHGQLPDVVFVVAGDGAAQNELAPLITDGTIYRFVHKPVSAQRVKLFVDAAWRKRDGTSSGATGQFHALSMSQTQPILPMPGPRPWPAIAAGALILGMAVGWYFLQSARPPASQAPAADIAAPAAHPAAHPAAPTPPPASIEPSARPQPAHESVQVTARHHATMTRPALHLQAQPTLLAVPAAAPIPAVKLSPDVAASTPTITAVSVASMPLTGGQPTSTPPVSEAKDPLSVAAVILEREHWVDPEFPEIAREQDLTGFVDLEFMVHADGSVTDVTVLRAQPLGIFDRAAVAAVRQWRYRPVQRDGIPVDEHARLRLNFGYK
ncbi:MAG TPA: energy transducer TonB [Steroidobacteraceae bacterium]|nr:energy transducer TonB [Steroidobacteraceae bacterium]